MKVAFDHHVSRKVQIVSTDLTTSSRRGKFQLRASSERIVKLHRSEKLEIADAITCEILKIEREAAVTLFIIFSSNTTKFNVCRQKCPLLDGEIHL